MANERWKVVPFKSNSGADVSSVVREKDGSPIVEGQLSDVCLAFANTHNATCDRLEAAEELLEAGKRFDDYHANGQGGGYEHAENCYGFFDSKACNCGFVKASTRLAKAKEAYDALPAARESGEGGGGPMTDGTPSNVGRRA